jgi:predicted flap endonuclease-1-like 5' DNA nuclease
LIAAFRAERLANRQALRADRVAARQSLRNERIGRLHPDAAHATPPVSPPPEAPAPDSVASSVSLFAQLVANERQSLASAPETEPQTDTAMAPKPHPAATALAEPPVQPVFQPGTPCADLAALGFGPGMTARLHHLGIVSVADLAAANADELRHLLGDVSDLINVDFWIGQARTLLRQAA